MKYVAFWSYTRFDDTNDELWLTALCTALVNEVRALSGKQIEIFLDVDGMRWGDQWKHKLVSSADDALFLIPIITPSYFESEQCRRELKQFVDRENAAAVLKDLILPIYYISTPKLDDKFWKESDYLAQKVAKHNYVDIRKLRHRPIDHYDTKQKIDELASELMTRFKTHARTQLFSPDMQAHFDPPPNGEKAPRKTLLSGTLENVPAGVDVWLVVETGTVYHPQGQQLLTNLFRESVIIGRKNADLGQKFTIHVLAATEDVSNVFSQYQKDSSSFGKWEGVPIPPDSRVLATVELIRHDTPEVPIVLPVTSRAEATARATGYQCTINDCQPAPGGAFCVDLNIYLSLGSQVDTIRYFTTAGYPDDTELRQVLPGDAAWSLIEPAKISTSDNNVIVHTKVHNRSHDRNRRVALEVDWH
jgi:hypothetical protein